MGDQDGVHLFRFVAGRLQVGRQLAGGRTDALPCPGVDQDKLFTSVDQKGVEGGLYPRGFNRTTGQQSADLALAHALQ
ncbi:hypothetical protein D3C81_2228750 [compost metagenome]